MSESKTNEARSDPIDCASRLKVLADSTRLQVLRLLIAGPRHVGALQQELEIEQSLLSHHLRTLRRTGLVVSRRDGKAVLYSIAPGVDGSTAGAADEGEAGRQPAEAIDLGCCRLAFPMDPITLGNPR